MMGVDEFDDASLDDVMGGMDLAAFDADFNEDIALSLPSAKPQTSSKPITAQSIDLTDDTPVRSSLANHIGLIFSSSNAGAPRNSTFRSVVTSTTAYTQPQRGNSVTGYANANANATVTSSLNQPRIPFNNTAVPANVGGGHGLPVRDNTFSSTQQNSAGTAPIVDPAYLQTLKKYFGHSSFRPMQWDIISSALFDR